MVHVPFDLFGILKVCGEPKESEIYGYDAFRLGLEQVAQMSIDADAVLRYQDSSSGIRTAIGFDERMLLHSEEYFLGNAH